jgi:hypothetical protein
MYYTVDDRNKANWLYRGEYMGMRHGVTPDEANQALCDPERVIVEPDPSSLSGRGVRVIGRTATERLLTVITLDREGVVWGVNGWDANPTDQRRYIEGVGL